MTNPQPLEPASLSTPINGVELRAMRKGQALTQVQLAARAGIAAPLISQIETGVRDRVRDDTFARIAYALNATAEQRTALRKQPVAA